MTDAPSAPAQDPPPAQPHYSFQEYELYYQTTERVIDRRISLNTWNYGICATILAAMGLATQWAVSNSAFMLLVFALNVLLGLMGALLCTLWISQIGDYKALNDAKFQILNAMAPHVKFEGGEVSFEPFRREWDHLKATNRLSAFKALSRLTLSSSTSEMMIPRAFRWIFMLAAVLFLAIAIANWGQMRQGLFRLAPQTAPPPVQTAAASLAH